MVNGPIRNGEFLTLMRRADHVRETIRIIPAFSPRSTRYKVSTEERTGNRAKPCSEGIPYLQRISQVYLAFVAQFLNRRPLCHYRTTDFYRLSGIYKGERYENSY